MLAGCTAKGGLVSPAPSRTGPAQLQIGNVIETATGKIITFDELVARLSNKSVIYVGEMHTSPEDHKAQLAVLKKLSQEGQCVELGMEMFPAESQSILDRYIRGEMTEDEFLREIRWNEVWGFPYQLYRGLIDFQKQRHMPVLGLNAPNEVVKKIGHGGLASLTPEERSRVAREFHLDDPKNRLRIQKEYAWHGKETIKDFESFFEAQLAWEETMAQTIAERLEQTGGRCKIVVVVGRGHISGGLGVPYLANIRKPHEYTTIAPIPINYPFSTQDRDLADYVIITEKSEPFHRPRLGVTIQPAASGRGMEILGISPESPASEAHLLKGDIILSVNGSPVNSIEEIQRKLAEGGPDYKILIERDKKNITVNVKIQR